MRKIVLSAAMSTALLATTLAVTQSSSSAQSATPATTRTTKTTTTAAQYVVLYDAGVSDALARGWDVTALHRGRTGHLPRGVHVLHADRTDPGSLATALGDQRWDAVVDTWAGAPCVATRTAEALAGQVERCAYVSSSSVYRWGEHLDETSPLVEGDPAGTSEDDYSAAKRGAELGVLASFPHALLLRAGLILGPHEDIGRLPWWLRRIAAGGRVVAPGEPDRPLQHVDARDLAAFALDAVQAGVSGPFDAISASGHTTTAGLLTACVDATGSDAELVWTSEADLAAAGAEPWTHLPCWVPQHGESAGFLEVDTTKAARAGLVCRPARDTVVDTWAWMQEGDLPPQRPDRAVHGLPREIEELLLRPSR